MAVRSDRLALGTFSGAADTDVTVYTVPAGKRTIIRSVVLYYVAATPLTVALRYRNADTPTNVEILRVTFAQFQRYESDLWTVLQDADEVRVRAIGASLSNFNVYLSGAELVV